VERTSTVTVAVRRVVVKRPCRATVSAEPASLSTRGSVVKPPTAATEPAKLLFDPWASVNRFAPGV
jgi:hypothetical protein